MKVPFYHILPLIMGVSSLGMLATQAAIVNQFTFNDGTTTDSVGGTTGTFVGNAAVITGALDLTGGYMTLANGIVTMAASGGTSGQVTLSVWAKATTNVNWAALYSFGSSVGSPAMRDYLQLIARNGATHTLRIATHAAGVSSQVVNASAQLSTTVFQHLVTTYDAGSGSIEFFVDGVSAGTATIPVGLNINTFTNTANSLGKSQFSNDPAFNGQISEFTVYDTALSQAEVTAAFNAKPVVVPEPSSMALFGLAGLALILRHRR